MLSLHREPRGDIVRGSARCTDSLVVCGNRNKVAGRCLLRNPGVVVPSDVLVAVELRSEQGVRPLEVQSASCSTESGVGEAFRRPNVSCTAPLSCPPSLGISGTVTPDTAWRGETARADARQFYPIFYHQNDRAVLHILAARAHGSVRASRGTYIRYGGRRD
jgi:hypothetical protein